MSETTILTYEYLLGISGFLVGKYIFGSKYFKNNVMKYGLIIGGLILIFMTFILNWEKFLKFYGIFLMMAGPIHWNIRR